MWIWGIAGVVALLPWLPSFAFLRQRQFLLFWWIFLPLSIPIALGSTKINAPSEILLLIWIAYGAWSFNLSKFKEAIFHPITALLACEIAVFAFSTVNSTILSVSLKRSVLHVSYICGAYFLMVPIFRKPQNLLKMGLAISLGIIPVLISGFLFFMKFHFNEAVAPAAPRPFFSDHTQFGAFAALVLPLLFVIWRYHHKMNLHFGRSSKILGLAVFIAVLFCFSRAVWLSMAAALLLYGLYLLRFRLWHLLLLLLMAGGIFYSYSDDLYQKALENKAESDQQEVVEQLKSIANIKTDVSNLERINRWKCAWKMFKEKPLTGFGPGTYQFQYGPYQELKDKTVISTNFGNAGNAHSEFLMYLSETGIFGFLVFLFLCFKILQISFRLIYHSTSDLHKYLALGLLLSFGSYLVHALVNSFFETDKIGILFYFLLAALVALDLNERSYKSV